MTEFFPQGFANCVGAFVARLGQEPLVGLAIKDRDYSALVMCPDDTVCLPVTEVLRLLARGPVCNSALDLGSYRFGPDRVPRYRASTSGTSSSCSVPLHVTCSPRGGGRSTHGLSTVFPPGRASVRPGRVISL